MASNIVLKTYAAGDNNQGSVTPQNDALIYQCAVPMNGLFSGGAVTLASANVLHVAAGFGIIGGRFFEILESDIAVQLSASGSLVGRLYVHLSLTNADEPIEIMSYTGASLPALSGDPTLNITNGDFDMELCQFEINEITISNIVNTYPTITASNNQIRRATAYTVGDFALCQSADDSLVFICTTAGTTAVSEPTGYATITDGNTITDGTAVFTAYNVSDSIYKSRQVSDSDDAYKPTKAYAVGELCIYNNVLYRCTTACSAGSWATNQSCFTADTLTGVSNRVNESLSPILIPTADFFAIGCTITENASFVMNGIKYLNIRVRHNSGIIERTEILILPSALACTTGIYRIIGVCATTYDSLLDLVLTGYLNGRDLYIGDNMPSGSSAYEFNIVATYR